MEARDLARVHALTLQLGYEATPEALGERLAELRKNPNHGLFVACDGENVPLGWVHVWGLYPMETEFMAQVGALVVDERVRGAGVGRALMEKAEAWAAERGFRVVTLRSRDTRDEAHAFYQSIGYAAVKTSVVFEKRLSC